MPATKTHRTAAARRGAKKNVRHSANGRRKPDSPWLVVKRSPISGKGGFARKRIPKGTRIIEYKGQRVDAEEADRRYDDDAMEVHHTFLFGLENGTCIDAAVRGNDARFVNHSCDPNCEAVEEGDRVFIEALRDIERGEELVYDYAYEREGRMRPEWRKLYACRCGAKNCRGMILKRKRSKRSVGNGAGGD
jgi:SET domain-containing protein